MGTPVCIIAVGLFLLNAVAISKEDDIPPLWATWGDGEGHQWRLRDILLSTEAMLMIDCVAAIALFAYMLVVTWNSMAPSASDYLLLRGSAKVKVCKEVACLLARLH